MLRIKSDTAVIIRSVAGKCNYFCTEQRQVGSSWLCNKRTRCMRAVGARFISPLTSNPHELPASSLFPPLCYSFPMFLKAVLNGLAAFFPLPYTLSVLTGKDSKLSISKDLMLKITLNNWLKGLKHAFPSVSQL